MPEIDRHARDRELSEPQKSDAWTYTEGEEGGACGGPTMEMKQELQ